METKNKYFFYLFFPSTNRFISDWYLKMFSFIIYEYTLYKRFSVPYLYFKILILFFKYNYLLNFLKINYYFYLLTIIFLYI